MNTTELIEIARECGGRYAYTKWGYHPFSLAELQQLARRIEQPLQDRITEVTVKSYNGLNDKNKQIEQLREALQGFLDAHNEGHEPSSQTVFLASIALEETK